MNLLLPHFLMKNILISSALIILGGLFFVINDGIINFLSPKGIQFYHFVFYGTPTYLLLLLYLILKGDLKKELKTCFLCSPTGKT